MAKRAKQTKKRVNVIDSQGWGSTSKEIAPEPPAADPVVLPAPEQAVQILADLAALNDKVLLAHERYSTAQSLAKSRKAEWERLAGELQDALKKATHPDPMPLFDAQQAETDLAAMTDAQNTSPAGTA